MPLLRRCGRRNARDRGAEADAVDSGEEVRRLKRRGVERDLGGLLEERDGRGVDSGERAERECVVFCGENEEAGNKMSFFLFFLFFVARSPLSSSFLILFKLRPKTPRKNSPERLFYSRSARGAMHPLD